ncbi:hypothetical protein Patl1_13021 [Pistacia atlantica]|uniref:Uncharacterized protein n=1 Tax=Pistacia atlantica TaxID=434234 RepID=A0ACC1AW51_9ROSI|nr:hypothetical protein Patl1_13021 [Pistacia atlantica]
MPRGVGGLSTTNIKAAYDVELMSSSTSRIQHELWPLEEINPKAAREDGIILDFSGSNFVNADDFAFGAVARYLQLDRNQCCFPPNLAAHACNHGYQHTEFGTSITWDDALRSSVRQFEHKTYNLFTCNCHSFVANCLNRLCYGGSMGWNMINVAALILFKGHWVNSMSIIRSFLPFVVVLCIGVLMVGWPFLIGLFSFSFLLLGWFVFGTYCVAGLIEC